MSSRVKSTRAVQNFKGERPVDFRYDPVNSRFVMGNNPVGHEGIPGGFPDSAPGGRIRFENGTLITDEWSGHYGHFWTPEIRTKFVDFMKRHGVVVTHVPWEG